MSFGATRRVAATEGLRSRHAPRDEPAGAGSYELPLGVSVTAPVGHLSYFDLFSPSPRDEPAGQILRLINLTSAPIDTQAIVDSRRSLEQTTRAAL